MMATASSLAARPAARRILVVAPQPFYQDRGTPIAMRHVLTALSALGDLTGRESPLFAGLTLLYLACLIGLIIGLLRELLPDHPLLLRLRRIRPKAVPAP